MRIIRFTVFLCFLITVIVATTFAGFREYFLLPWFMTQEISVSAGWPLPGDRVSELLNPLKGRNLLWVGATDAATCLKTLGWLESVSIKKNFPNQLVVSVLPRQAVAIQVAEGAGYFIDRNAKRIERTSPDLLGAFDLPIISSKDHRLPTLWDFPKMLVILGQIQERFHAGAVVSELMLGNFPHFKIFFASPPLEVDFSVDNWEAQLPILQLLLHSPPRNFESINQINLGFSKKAIVTRQLSN